MKKCLFTAFAAVCFLPACKKDSSPDSFHSKPYSPTVASEAIAKYDASNFGIYKGVVINAQDSSAAFRININNNRSYSYTSYYKDDLYKDSLIRYKTGVGGINFPQAVDTSSLAENVQTYAAFASWRIGVGPIVEFGVQANGSSPVMDVQLNNNATLTALMKEKSNRQVYCFEGSYNGSDSGSIAFVATADSIVMLRASTWNPQFFKNTGAVVSGNNFVLNQQDDISGNNFEFKGTMNLSSFSGTWTKSSAPNVIGHFTVRRTL